MAVIQDTWSPGALVKNNSYEGRVRDSVRTANFGSLAKDNKPVNPYSDIRRSGTSRPYTEYRVLKSSGAITYNYNNVLFYSGDFRNSALVNFTSSRGWDSEIAAAQNEAKLGALVKVADAKVNVAVAYAEAAKTSDLILDTARRIDRAYRAFRRGRLGDLAKELNITPKRLHKSWLEYKYGWMPLLMDVKGAAEFFAQQHVVRPPRFKCTRVINRSKTYDYVNNVASYGGGALNADSYSARADAVVRATIWCELSSPHLSELQQIGLTNPALVAWELVPFSFVFDWFISVGDWLTGLTALQGVNVRRTLLSTLNAQTYVQRYPATVRSDATWTYYMNGMDITANNRTYTRGTFVPDALSLYPPVTNSFGFSKLVTSLALIQGNYRGNSRTARI